MKHHYGDEFVAQALLPAVSRFVSTRLAVATRCGACATPHSEDACDEHRGRIHQAPPELAHNV